MNVIGLFEAKTRLSQICAQVAATRQPVVVTRRGKPVVKITPADPVKPLRKSVWDRRAEYEHRHGLLSESFALPPKEKQRWHNPLRK